MANKGLYTKELEHDSCGVGCVADIKNVASHENVKDALTMLKNMEHRGATGSDENTGDGCGSAGPGQSEHRGPGRLLASSVRLCPPRLGLRTACVPGICRSHTPRQRRLQ